MIDKIKSLPWLSLSLGMIAGYALRAPISVLLALVKDLLSLLIKVL